MYCAECQTDEIVIGCLFCLEKKIIKLKVDLNFIKNELELIKESCI